MVTTDIVEAPGRGLFIRNVRVKGFRQFKNPISIPGGFSPETNLIIGYNGSGKSNFINAILFVISDKFKDLARNMRESLLHKGIHGNSDEASVSIYFDNTCGAINMEHYGGSANDVEIVVTRTITKETDRYAINDRFKDRKVVIDLLEAAGISESNPFFVVQQNKVMEVACMDPPDRWDMIRDAFGAKLFDEKAAKGEKRNVKNRKMFSDMKRKMQKAQGEHQKLIEESLRLEEFNRLEQRANLIELELQSRDHVLADEKHRILAQELDVQESRSHEFEDKKKKKMSRIQELEAEIELNKGKKKDQEKKKNPVREKKNEAAVILKRTKLECNQLESYLNKNTEKVLQDEKKQTFKEIHEATENLTKIGEKLQRPGHSTELQNLEKKRTMILGKLNSEGRDGIKAAIQQKETKLKENRGKLERTEKEIRMLGKMKSELKDPDELNKEAGMLTKNQSRLQAEFAKAKEEYNGLIDDLRAKTAEKMMNAKKLETRTNECNGFQQVLERTMPAGVRNALKYIRTDPAFVTKGWKTVLDYMTVDKVYRQAVERAGANKLFHLVVDSMQDASRVITAVRKEFSQKKESGQIEVVPLQEQHDSRPNYPKEFLESSRPMVDCIDVENSRMKSVMYQIFGNFLICENMEVCREVGKRGYIGITLDGQQVNPNGMVHGGYDNSKFVRIENAQKVRQLKKEIERLTKEKNEVDKQIAVLLDKQVHDLENMEKSMQENDKLKRGIDELTRRRTDEFQKRIKLDQDLTEEKKQKQILEQTISTDEKILVLAREKSSPEGMKNYLKDVEKEIESAKIRQQKFQKDEDDLKQRRDDLLRSVQNKREKLTSIDEELSTRSEKMGKLLHLETKKTVEQKEFEELEKEEKEFTQEQEEVLAALEKCCEERAELTNEQDSFGQELERIQSATEKIRRKLAIVQEKKNSTKSFFDQAKDRVVELQYFSTFLSNELRSDLQDSRKRLSEFGLLNMDATEFANSVGETYKKLEKDMEKSSDVYKQLNSLISSIHIHKEHVLYDGFEKVNKAFSTIFTKLVGPSSKALMKRVKENNHEGEGAAKENGLSAENEKEQPHTDSEETHRVVKPAETKYSVHLSTNFGSGRDRKNALSGGQKTIIALSQILAFQKVVAAPFYILDEVDAALDKKYKHSFAQVLMNQIKEGGKQFILTTFSPELVDVSSRIYQIIAQRSIPIIKRAERETALDVIKPSQDEQNLASDSIVTQFLGMDSQFSIDSGPRFPNDVIIDPIDSSSQIIAASQVFQRSRNFIQEDLAHDLRRPSQRTIQAKERSQEES